MTENKKLRNAHLYTISCLLILTDQLTKLYFRGFDFFGWHHQGYYYGESRSVLGEFVRFTYIENPGMAFGIGFGSGKFLLGLFSVIATIVLAWVIGRMKSLHNGVRTGFALILAGAAGNLVDRVFYGVVFDYAPLFYGKVVDFIQVDIPDISIGSFNYTHWPVFNVADSCVSVGVVLLLIFNRHIPPLEFFPPKRRRAAPSSETAETGNE